MLIYGLTRVRNEAEIIRQTLDAWGLLCDKIWVFDDASTDDTQERVSEHPAVSGRILSTRFWQPGPQTEGEQRQTLYRAARQFPQQPEWYCCFDADEISSGITRNSIGDSTASGITCHLFDFYRTPWDQPGEPLKFCGPEYRNILIFWKPRGGADFRTGIVREPIGVSPTERIGRIKHYGKALSEERWEQKCDFYSKYFPDSYKRKWADRHGKFIHTESDFGRPLIRWEEIEKTQVGPCLYSYC